MVVDMIVLKKKRFTAMVVNIEYNGIVLNIFGRAICV